MALLEEMGVEDERARTLKKDALVTFVAECAVERQWAPVALAWDRAPTPDDEAEADDASESDGGIARSADESAAAPLAA